MTHQKQMKCGTGLTLRLAVGLLVAFVASSAGSHAQTAPSNSKPATNSSHSPEFISHIAPNANLVVTTPPPGGTTGYIPVFTGANTIGNSPIYQCSGGESCAGVNGNFVVGNYLYVDYINGGGMQSDGQVYVQGSEPNSSSVVGVNFDAGSPSYGILGQSQSTIGTGVMGHGLAFSNTYQTHTGTQPFGVVGDAANQPPGVGGIPVGVWGSADAGIGLVTENNSSEPSALLLNFDTNPRALAFEAAGEIGGCTIDVQGDLSCTGNKAVSVSLPDNRAVLLYGIEATGNWFEDFGTGTLMNGVATVTLDATFAQTVNTHLDYHVYITPNGDCDGLYVANKTQAGFEVRELRGGHSTIGFDYRIVAHRLGYENVRLEDVTERQAHILATREKMMKTNEGVTIPVPTRNPRK